jgi:hypothetical protein
MPRNNRTGKATRHWLKQDLTRKNMALNAAGGGNCMPAAIPACPSPFSRGTGLRHTRSIAQTEMQPGRFSGSATTSADLSKFALHLCAIAALSAHCFTF